MSDEEKRPNINTKAREAAVQFLYQCHQENIFFFRDLSFKQFIDHFSIPIEAVGYLRFLVEKTLDDLTLLDRTIEAVSENWKINRINVTDLCVIRIALTEFNHHKQPPKVIINEGVELAKKFGTENSGRFVNGILDKLVKPS